MKKILCLLIAALVPMLMFTACAEKKDPVTTTSAELKAEIKGEELTAGIYVMTSDSSRQACSVQIRTGNKVAVQYQSKTITESGTYTIENNSLRVNAEKFGSEYVFDIKDGTLVYNANASKPSQKFLKEAGVADGEVFRLDHTLKAR